MLAAVISLSLGAAGVAMSTRINNKFRTACDALWESTVQEYRAARKEVAEKLQKKLEREAEQADSEMIDAKVLSVQLQLDMGEDIISTLKPKTLDAKSYLEYLKIELPDRFTALQDDVGEYLDDEAEYKLATPEAKVYKYLTGRSKMNKKKKEKEVAHAGRD